MLKVYHQHATVGEGDERGTEDGPREAARKAISWISSARQQKGKQDSCPLPGCYLVKMWARFQLTVLPGASRGKYQIHGSGNR